VWDLTHRVQNVMILMKLEVQIDKHTVGGEQNCVVELRQNMKSEIITAGPDIDFLINGFSNC